MAGVIPGRAGVGDVGAVEVTEAGDLNELMTDTAAALAQVLPNPGDWPGWLVILLHELERQAMAQLGEVIETRLGAGQWPPVI